ADAGISIRDYSAPFEQAFLEDLDSLRIQRPEQLVRATEHIPKMVELIQKLAAAGAAYQTEDGSWYFRLSAFPAYGKLSKKDLSGMEDGARVDVHGGGEDLMFPHHENEIAQSETVTHKTFARHWMHVRFLLVDGRKMSKSEGNFYTPRDLLLKGYKASAIRLALISVPYRNQLNFTFDGLIEATAAIDRLRTFHDRLVSTHLEPGKTPEF